jgi:CheY-like chemotaxis protein
MLSLYGIKVSVCLSGAEAVEIVQSQDFDLVLMDYMMPGMNGIEATAAIRILPGDQFKKMPIIAFTANAVLGMREVFLENGFDGFLYKPIEMPKLNDLLERHIPAEKRIPGISHTANRVRAALPADASDKEYGAPDKAPPPAAEDTLRRLKEALVSEDAVSADAILEELARIAADEPTIMSLSEIADCVLLSDFDRAAETAEALLARRHGNNEVKELDSLCESY